MRSVNTSITSLSKSAKSLKEKLEESGLEVDIEEFRTGPGGTTHFGPSYIIIEVSDGDDLITRTRLHCGGYGDVVTWGNVKKEILEEISGWMLK